jgi:hypothetical protein
LTVIQPYSYTTPLFQPSGQVAQLVERGPEKAGVGGSIPSLATNNFNNLQIAKNIQISTREQYANIHQPTFAAFAHCGSRIFQSSRAVACGHFN